MIETGFSKIPDKEYFSDREHFTRRDIINLAFNPLLYTFGEKKTETDALRLGTVFDAICNLPVEVFREKVRAKEKRGEKSEDENLFILTPKDFETIEAMYFSWLNNGFVEYLKDWDSQVVICDGKRKGKVDFISPDRKTIIDIKTIDSIDSIQKHTEDYFYYFQEFWYKKIMENIGYKVETFNFYFIEKAHPHRIQIVELDGYEDICENILERAIDNFNDKHTLTNLVTTKRIKPSKWLRRDYE